MCKEFNYFIGHCFEKKFSREVFLAFVCVCGGGGGVHCLMHKSGDYFFVIY
jgi:hypothetical protein